MESAGHQAQIGLSVLTDRPICWRILPDRVKSSLYHRFLYPPSERWQGLYESASLRFAPNVEVELQPSDRMHGQIAFLGYYEKRLSKVVARLGREIGGKFVDVGANLGYYTLLWIAQDPENEAIAIEPSPRVTPLLQKNIERNGVGEQVTIIEAAVGDEEGKVSFDLGPRDETGWGGVSTKQIGAVTEDSEGMISVPQYRLDDMIQESVSLLKVDVEGAERWVFQGSKNLLHTQKIKRICFEDNRIRAQSLGIEEKPSDFLTSHGYDVFRKEGTLWAEPNS